jgi:hypothetical protein
LSGDPRLCKADDGCDGIEMLVNFWEYNGIFQKKEKKIKLWKTAFRESDDMKANVQSLSVFPLRLAPLSTADELGARGRMFWYMCSPWHVSYSGPDADSDEFVVSQSKRVLLTFKALT